MDGRSAAAAQGGMVGRERETRGRGEGERKPESRKAGRRVSECVRKWGREREQGGEYGELASLQFLLLRGGEHRISFLLVFSVFSVPLW